MEHGTTAAENAYKVIMQEMDLDLYRHVSMTACTQLSFGIRRILLRWRKLMLKRLNTPTVSLFIEHRAKFIRRYLFNLRPPLFSPRFKVPIPWWWFTHHVRWTESLCQG